ncbi:MAG: hypothetical protein PHZ25_01980 [Candidatus Pacebacteria bacterium]|nr:hypothetical protein [Candidatus Paceibacterota bacterium]
MAERDQNVIFYAMNGNNKNTNEAKSIYTLDKNDLNSRIATSYSKMKLGDEKEIKKFAKNLVKIIKNDIKKNKIERKKIVLTHVPTIMKESGIHYIVEKISSKLELQIIELKRLKYSFNYQLMSEEKRKDKTRNLINCPQSVKNKNILLIDDSKVTGSMLNASESCLRKKGANKILKYVLVVIKTKKPGIEGKFDMAAYNKTGLRKVINLINKNQNTPTNFRITMLFNLPKYDQKKAIDELSKNSRKWIRGKVRTFNPKTPIGGSFLKDI